MNSNKNNIRQNEIDLADIIVGIWNNKFIIVSFSVAFIIITFVSQISQTTAPIIYRATTEIKPISIFEENKYNLYNAYLRKFNKQKYYGSREEGEDQYKNTRDNFSNFSFMNKSHLMDLFVDKLNETTFHIESIKKFGLVDKKDYQSDEDYENAVVLLASSIRVISNEKSPNHWIINFETSNLNSWINYLYFIEKETNKVLGFYLKNRFENLISNEKKLNNYEIKDIEIEISNMLESIEKDFFETKDEATKSKYDKKLLLTKLHTLEMTKKFLLTNNDILRFEEIIKSTPVMNTKKFSAGQLSIGSTTYKKLSRDVTPISKKIILAGIFGLIFGMIYVLISNTIKKKKLI